MIYSQSYTKGDGALPAQTMNNNDMVASPDRTYRYFASGAKLSSSLGPILHSPHSPTA